MKGFWIATGGVALCACTCALWRLGESRAAAYRGLEGPTARAVPASANLSPDEPGAFERLKSSEGVSGGALVFTLPGTPEEVLEALLDFEAAAGHRSWARSFRTLERSPDRVVAEWKFRGKLGIHPTVTIEFLVDRRADGARIAYGVLEPAFGIARFEGAIDLRARAGDPDLCEVRETVFIDSGLAFANASFEDIEAGLRRDAELLAAWMRERRGS